MDFVGFITNNIILTLLIITVLVFVHEWGHYWIGVRNGVHAEVFSIGFGPEVWGWTSRKTGTRWRFAALPLGGYVKFLGDANATGAGAGDDSLTAEQRKRAFHTQSLGVRAAVVVAGPAANLIFAVVLMAILLMTLGQPYTPPTVVVVDSQGAAAKAGLRTGDTIVSIGGRSVDSFEDALSVVQINPGVALPVTLTRDGKTQSLMVTPTPHDYKDRFGNVHRLGELGVASTSALPVIGRVLPGSVAESAGLRAGDRVVEVEGTPIQYFGQIPKIVRERPNQPTTIKVDRDGATVDIVATPAAEEVTGADGKPRFEGRLGFSSSSASIVRTMGPVDAGVEATVQVWRMTGTIYTVIRQIVLGLRPANEIGGPIRIAKTAGEVSQIGWSAVFYFIIGLSVTLGVFNLLPIPMLDGGHLLFYAIEWIRGRPLSARAQDIGFRIGLAVMGSLMVFATFNDISLLIGRILPL
ncbi:RIP metalloprotease RseP [Reyranella sp. CPCC 100927]|uniref:RIP metalloprotease RseP n=1 Tax=Reyranella sp. CPCC 100927 TaxID=2599616 RepID=UPI0011B538EC|nr:RIP metalloprotease RseP [Reyranella sp. CPCC 100927]TWT09591.1 RIP metalloprotease RseP [Reyranella sp. CPCC 100927]